MTIPITKIENLIKDHTPNWMLSAAEFIPGKTPIYYSGPFYGKKELVMAMDAFLNGKWLVAGEHVHKFEIAFSKMFSVGYSLMVNSGSSANLVMLTALKKHLKWKDGDEIIVSPVGFPTTIAPIVQNGLKPIFVDIEWDSLNFDIEEIRKKITPRTRAIFVSPVLGNPPDMDALRELVKEFPAREWTSGQNIILIGDNCDSLGSKWRTNYVSDYYYAWTSSFYPAHHITTGEGGMVSSDNEDFIKMCRSIAWWGRACYCVGTANLLPCGTCGNRFDKWIDGYNGVVDHKYVFENMGYNLKPLDLQGALGLGQLDSINMIETLRVFNKLAIEEMVMKNIKGVRVVKAEALARPIWFGVPIICDTAELKQKLQQHFESNKIQTRNYFAGNILRHSGYSHLDDYKMYPNANQALDRVFFLGCSPNYTEAMLDYIEEVCEKW